MKTAFFVLTTLASGILAHLVSDDSYIHPSNFGFPHEDEVDYCVGFCGEVDREFDRVEVRGQLAGVFLWTRCCCSAR